ncbi:thioredoxin family protein [Caldisalinibacter kiritimatiensis]|uniref:Thioredoxin n=1 Tax=Caldisalinibacter kiritimatiensis TaxID=1304284 RepID=R1ATQ5_9FIRM|nr:thioredoxin family protein [Caldisalinibacter kiritimatiensis]EOD00017.1 hypothetical protein L21TH_1960 [Caldisalinibacter kiritimatiensis]
MEACDLFNKGTSFEKFVNRDNGTYKEKTLEVLNSIEFSEELAEQVKSINRKIKILVCAELWCPDCMINVPVLEKMSQINSNISFSIVGKEGNEDFFKKFCDQEKIRIPTFVFYDEDFNELGSFVEHPKQLKYIMEHGSQANIIVAKRKYKKGEYAEETLKDILEILL